MNKIITRISLFAITIFLLIPTAFAFQMQGCSSDCASCHTLTKEEASTLIKADVLKATVVGVRMSEVKGMWEVQLYHDNTISPVYIDFGKKYLIAANITPLSEIGKKPEIQTLDVSKIPLDNALIMGNPKAKIKVIVFTDPDCPFCRKLHAEIKNILAERKDIVFYIKLYPLKDIHPDAYGKSKVIQCSKSLKLLDDAFNAKELPKTDCDTKEVDKNIELGNKLGMAGTPSIILPDGRMIPSYLSKEQLYSLLGIK